MTEEKIKLKSLIRFHSANKINNYNRAGGKGEKKKKVKKKSKRAYTTGQNLRIINVFLSHCSQSAFPRWESSPCDRLLHNPKTPAPSCCTFQGTWVPVQGMYGCGKDYLILIPFRLPQISCFTLSLKCFSSDSDNCPDVGIGPLLQFLHPPRAGPS